MSDLPGLAKVQAPARLNPAIPRGRMIMKIRTSRAAAIVAVATPLLLMAFGAQAHAHLVRATPAPNSAVHSPIALHLQYSEKLEPKFSGASVMKADGKAVAAGVKVSARAMDVTPKAALTPGGYMVMWHVVSADGHRIKGQYNFTVK